MRIVSWGAEGFISVALVPQAEIITTARYLQALRNLCPTLRDRLAEKKEMIMQHERARCPSVLVGAWTGVIGMFENFSVHPTVRT